MKFTIITPSFNQGKFLEQTIRSVIEQDHDDLEYFVMDGGSTDESVDVIKKYGARIDFWVSEHDRGQSHAINKGLERATGDIVTWINSDDQLLPGALKAAESYFTQDPDTWLIHGRSLINNGKTEFAKGAIETDLDARYLAGLPYPQPSSFFRKKAIDQFGLLDEEFHYGMDYDLLMRINLNHKVQSVQDIFSRYLLHDDSKSIMQNDRFAHDWAAVYCRFLRTLQPQTNQQVSVLKELGLYHMADTTFECSRSFTDDLIDRSLAYFLINQVIFYFQAGDFKISNRLLNYLKRHNREIYDREKLSRSHLLSKPGVNLYETMKRNFRS